MTGQPPFALFIRGPQDLIFDLSDELGFSDAMQALALSVFEDGPDTFHVQALYASQADAQFALAALQIPPGCEAFISQLPDEDWVSKSQQGLPPVFAGRFCVFGAHSASEIPADTPFPIRIEAGAAFGTGHHGTTKGCLMLFDEMLKTGNTPKSILDLGCGAGTLAIGAAMALGIDVLATDIDPEAVTVTIENAEINRVTGLIDAKCINGFDDSAFSGRQFDLIFANILAGPLMGLAPEISEFLMPGGHTILSGILDEQADKVAEIFAANGISTKKGPSLSGWTSLLGIKTLP